MLGGSPRGRRSGHPYCPPAGRRPPGCRDRRRRSAGSSWSPAGRAGAYEPTRQLPAADGSRGQVGVHYVFGEALPIAASEGRPAVQFTFESAEPLQQLAAQAAAAGYEPGSRSEDFGSLPRHRSRRPGGAGPPTRASRLRTLAPPPAPAPCAWVRDHTGCWQCGPAPMSDSIELAARLRVHGCVSRRWCQVRPKSAALVLGVPRRRVERMVHAGPGHGRDLVVAVVFGVLAEQLRMAPPVAVRVVWPHSDAGTPLRRATRRSQPRCPPFLPSSPLPWRPR